MERLGCGKELGQKISVITELKTLKEIKSIHCSICSSFALTDNGMVYSWGENHFCHLGHELKENECVFVPKLIESLTKITSICSTIFNTYFLSRDGIYFCGFFIETDEICYQLSPKCFISITVNRKVKPSIISLHSRICTNY